MMLPFSVTIIDSAIPADTTAAPAAPSAIAVASLAGLGEAAIALAGITYWTAAFTAMYSAATTATPLISATGKLRCGLRISPETLVTMFQPSYAHKAATSAAINPAIPPFAPAKLPLKFAHEPRA